VQIIREREDLARGLAELWAGAETVALVPTMGALHEGHLALVREAGARAEAVAATIFVNPLQFGPSEDLARYPRSEERDLQLLAAEGCDLVWLPTVEDLYPAGFATSIEVAGVSERWEGAARPGHFAGVATVVAKLLIALSPDLVIFGEKDWQQVAVVRRLVEDLGLPHEILAVPTVREADGLALSSRNAYLSADERGRAVALPLALARAAQRIADGEAAGEALAEAKNALQQAGFGPIDYLALVDEDTLEPLDHARPGSRLIVAARLGSTRLIDNLAVLPASSAAR
jgi:pantoate--beta-alanine ligase